MSAYRVCSLIGFPFIEVEHLGKAAQSTPSSAQEPERYSVSTSKRRRSIFAYRVSVYRGRAPGEGGAVHTILSPRADAIRDSHGTGTAAADEECVLPSRLDLLAATTLHLEGSLKGEL